MVIYDPPQISGSLEEWARYFDSLADPQDAEERERVSEFMQRRFHGGLSLEEYAIAYVFAE